MLCLLTSSHNTHEQNDLNPANGFADEVRKALPYPCRGVAIASDPDNPDEVDFFCGCVRADFARSGVPFCRYTALDRRNQNRAEELIRDADLVILMGGHVPTQNRFFQDLRLREILKGYDGVVVGISAGSMNSCDPVYAQPELPGESTDPHFVRWLPGLGLTKTMILPHHQRAYYNMLDGARLFQDITYPDSMGHVFYGIPDGSYVYVRDGREELRGESWRIADGVRTQFSREGETVLLVP